MAPAGTLSGVDSTAARALLGLADGVALDAETIRGARRQAARRSHPDAGGAADAMVAVNTAADLLLAELRGGASSATAMPPPGGFRTTVSNLGHDPRVRTGSPGVRHDDAAFVVESPAPQAFAWLVAACWTVGTILDEDPPGRLDVRMFDPTPCWCRIDLLHEGDTSTAALTIAGLNGIELPDIETVRDRWVAALNTLDDALDESANDVW